MPEWYEDSDNSADLRDPMGSTAGWETRNVGTDTFDVTSFVYNVAAPNQYVMTMDEDTGLPETTTGEGTVSCTSGGVGVGIITIEQAAGSFGGGGFRSYSKVVRPLNITDVARYGGTVTNIDADMADDDQALATWLW